VALSARLLAAKGIRPTWRVAGPVPVRLVGFDLHRRRLVAVAALTSAGQLFRALVELMGHARLAGTVRRGLPAVEVHRWTRAGRRWVCEVCALAAGDFAPRTP
jgi:hypothetical protein